MRRTLKPLWSRPLVMSRAPFHRLRVVTHLSLNVEPMKQHSAWAVGLLSPLFGDPKLENMKAIPSCRQGWRSPQHRAPGTLLGSPAMAARNGVLPLW